MTAAELRAGQRFAGHRLLRIVGHGEQGVVWLAQPVASTALVALKLVALNDGDAVAAADFLARAEAARRLVHPGIVAVHAAGIDGTTGWLAMEAAPGVTIDRYTRPALLLPPPIVVELGEAVALALAHAHRQGVVHRDLKPGNIIANWPDGGVKLADFGLARSPGTVRTATGVVPGSPAYMAPEQLAGAVPTPASDFYALGATLFHLLAGRLPHDAASLGELLRSVASVPAPSLQHLGADVPHELSTLVARLLDRDPAQRGADGDAVAAALRRSRAAMPAAGAATPLSAPAFTTPAPGGAKSR